MHASRTRQACRTFLNCGMMMGRFGWSVYELPSGKKMVACDINDTNVAAYGSQFQPEKKNQERMKQEAERKDDAALQATYQFNITRQIQDGRKSCRAPHRLPLAQPQQKQPNHRRRIPCNSGDVGSLEGEAGFQAAPAKRAARAEKAAMGYKTWSKCRTTQGSSGTARTR
eukprot:678175-Pleurochrysis_carterae.AAC.2